MAIPLKDFTQWAEEETNKLDAILRGQEDAKKRMSELIAVLKSKEEWDESGLALMNSMAEQILEVAGDNGEAVALADLVREKADLVAKLLSDKTYDAMQRRSMDKDGK